MTDRLYYTDSYRSSFEARVVACEARPAPAGSGHGFAVELDATAFYPTSGGQPFDTGSLGEARVVEVADEADGRIVHVTDAPVAVGATVQGRVDWPRRFDHMQQHTGQHVLSAAFDRLQANRTESFHLGAELCSIDLGREATPREVADAVDEANRVVWDDRAVTVRFVSAEEAAVLPLRKEPARAGRLRLVEIDGFDLSACGGTHVARTGAIGVIAVAAVEKLRGGSRVHFLCGRRVLRRFDAWRDAWAATMKHLSVAPEDMGAAVERVQAENKALQRSLRAAHEALAGFEAQALVARGTRRDGRTIVVEVVPDADAARLKALAVAAAGAPGVAVALFTANSPALVVVARHADSGVDAAAVLKGLVARFGGRGGGKPDLAQGGGLDAPPEVLTAAARELLG